MTWMSGSSATLKPTCIERTQFAATRAILSKASRALIDNRGNPAGAAVVEPGVCGRAQGRGCPKRKLAFST